MALNEDEPGFAGYPDPNPGFCRISGSESGILPDIRPKAIPEAADIVLTHLSVGKAEH